MSASLDLPYRDDTVVAHAGSHPAAQHGCVNPPVYHASTVLFPTLSTLEQSVRKRNEPGHFHYGRYGTPTARALEEAMVSLEGGDHALAVPSGVAAVCTALLAFLNSGDHLLMVDTVYEPVRSLCDHFLRRLGIVTEYYDPRVGTGISALLRPSTRVVYMESPGSLTFEVQDVPAIAAAAHSHGAVAVLDNTWATPLYFKPFGAGIDVSVHAATKYIVGHSDAMLGVLVMRKSCYMPVRLTATALGHSAAPDDCYLGLRGLRSLSVRLARHYQTGLVLARWLAQRPEVRRVIHPALPDHPDHALWRRDFRGASGLFAVVLKPCGRPALEAMVNGLKLFGMGFSWGGFESLVLPSDPAKARSAVPWHEEGPLLRIHAGLEDPTDLIQDLEAGFARLAAAGGEP